MAAQQSAQPVPQSHHPQKRSRWFFITIIIVCILTVLFFIGAAIFWIGLVHDKLPDLLGVIFTVLGTIFGFIALVLAIPPFMQFLQERRVALFTAPSLINTNNKNDQSQPLNPQVPHNLGSIDNAKAQGPLANLIATSNASQQFSRPSQTSHSPNSSATQSSAMNSSHINVSRDISSLEKDRLVEKLLECPTMRERSSRNRVVKELTFKDSISRNSDATNKEDVRDIVDRCLNFPDGLQQLVGRIASREENSMPMRELFIFIQNLS